MTNRSPDNRPLQKAGRNAEFVGRDKITTTNVSVWISFLLVGFLALGGIGIAWAINTGWLRGSGNPQQPNANPKITNTSQ